MNKKICILDYGSGNVRSVFNVCSRLAETIISNDAKEIIMATHIILPGVGSFGRAMEKINQLIPVELLLEEILKGKKPFLGICVGMQVMLSKGYEFGEWEGLNIIPGRVKLIDTNLTLPHVGWNDLNVRIHSPITENLPQKSDFYFVHSYRAEIDNENEVLAKTFYGVDIPAVITASGTNIYGVQFHPEKSQHTGKIFLQNFLRVEK
jgi:glutamine amidotransferase